MHDYTLADLSDAVLLRDLAALVAQDRLTTATLLAHIAEVDARRLYVPAGYPSMHAYCVEELRLSEDAALRRIQAARAARQFPALLPAVAEGRLHLTAVCLLAPHLTEENAAGLIEGATHRRKSEIEAFLVRQFARGADATPMIQAVVPIPARPVPLPGPAGAPDEHALAHVEEGRSEAAPLSPERYLLKLTIEASTHEKLRYAQALLSHALPTGDLAQVLDRALDTLITDLEKRKLGALPGGPRRVRRATGRRHVPARVRRAVWERDQGQCTFVGATGHRCTARRFLEFDHVEPVARGGKATVDGMRLRCRAHNQYEAERVFGAEFMRRKRQEARRAAEARVVAAERARAMTQHAPAHVEAEAPVVEDIVAGLRGLGCRAQEARRAAEFSETLHGATLEERMRAALKFLGHGLMRGHSPAGTHASAGARPAPA